MIAPLPKPKRLLIVDDNPQFLELVRVLLSGTEYQVHTASGAGSARAFLATGLEPDVVLLDLCMPGMDGASLLGEWIRSDELRGSAVVTMSGLPVERTPEGAVLHLSKPFTRARLLSVLRAFSERVALRERASLS